MHRNEIMIYRRSSTVSAMLFGAVVHGDQCRMTCRHGKQSINSHNVGLQLAYSKRLCMTCVRCCAWQKARKNNRLRPFLTDEPCNQRLKVAGGPDMTS